MEHWLKLVISASDVCEKANVLGKGTRQPGKARNFKAAYFNKFSTVELTTS